MSENHSKTCSAEGCDRPRHARGLCSTHRLRPKSTGTCRLDGCERPRYGHGWCQMHWRRVQNTGEPGEPQSKYSYSLKERLERGSDMSGDCWVWIASRDRGTYGALVDDSGKFERTHRIAYELFIGPIPEGMVVCHRCDNRPCWRPGHLFLGTVADNNRDMFAKGRGNALSNGVVKQIHALADAGVRPKDISERLGLPKGTVSARLFRRKKAEA